MMQPVGLTPSWNLGEKIVFRFLFIYFILYIFPFPVATFPYADVFMTGLSSTTLWNGIVVFTGKHILHLYKEITVLPNGSFDTTWNYVHVFVIFCASGILTLVWSVVDRKRLDYSKLFFWLIVVLRYYLAVSLVSYGFVKIIKVQFPDPSFDRLFQTYGQSSPMGLLWTFMGYSVSYNFFVGLGEALGGFLLFFRRTKLMGCLLNLAVLSNVVMLNFAYDVPVKLLSMHLLIMNFVVMAPDVKRLIDFFILHRPVMPSPLGPIFADPKWQIGYKIGKGVLIGYTVLAGLFLNYQRYRGMNGDYTSFQQFNGVYEIETQIVKSDTLPAKEGDTRRWKKIIPYRGNVVCVEYMDHARTYFQIKSDTLQKEFDMTSMGSSMTYHFRYKQHDDRYFLRGELFKDSVWMDVRNVTDPKELLLVNRGFHWVNENPYYW